MPESLPPTVLQAGGVPPIASDPDTPRFGPPAEPGELGRLAGYRVLKRLGRGGMGAVYLALDEGLQRRVALKVMLPQYAANTEASERFRREARSAAQVRHDNVVTVYQVGEDGGTPFIAMELLSGYPLDEYLVRKGRLTIPQALRVGAETAAGLAAAHAAALIHRDIKPANLWLEAPHGRVKILDFGLARPVEANSLAGLTSTGVILGTPAYMSPEQANADAVDHRTDLFSLGVVLYQLTTGRRPFDRPTVVESMLALVTDEPPPVRERNPDVPESLARIVHALLAKEPAARPQSAAEVAKALRAIDRGEPAPDQRELTATPTAAQPQVVYVPIQVTAYEPVNDEFANLSDPTDASTDRGATEHAEKPTAARPRPRFPVWAVGAAVLLAGGIAVATYFANRKPPEAVKQNSPEPGKDAPNGKQPGPAPKPADPQRALAEWVIAKSGSVKLATGEEVGAKDKLPPGPLAVVAVSFANSPYKLADADVARFTHAPRLKGIIFPSTELTDKGFEAIAALPQAPDLDTLILPSAASAAGVAHLTKCRSLTQLNVTGAALRGGTGFVKDCPALTHLTAGSAGLTDADLVPLHGTKLTHLGVCYNPGITADGVARLVATTNLTSLDLSDTGVKGKDAAVLAKFPNLTYLRLVNAKLTDDDVAAMRGLTKLHTLALQDKTITDRALDTIAALPELKDLVLNFCDISDVGLEKLVRAKTLVQLHLRGTKVTLPGVKRLLDVRPNCKVTFDYNPKADPDRQLAEWIISKGGSVAITGKDTKPDRVADLHEWPFRVTTAYFPLKHHAITDADLDRFRDTGVYHFSLGHGHAFTDDGLDKFTQFPGAERIKVLSLASPLVTAKGYAHLARLKNLEGLHLEFTPVTDDGLAVCRHLPKLKAVAVWRSQVTDKGLEHLAGLSLTHLELFDTAVTDAAAKFAGGIPTLEKLILQRTKVTNDGLKHLTGLKNLKHLFLGQTAVTDAGLEYLVGPPLVELELPSTAITDAGLKHLGRIKTLTTLDVRHTKVTDAGVADFKKALPNCKVLSPFDKP